MRAHQVTLNVANGNLSTARFQINRRSRGHLNFKIYVAYVSTIAIIAHDVDHQASFGLSGIEMHRRRFHCGRNANLVTRPGFNCDRAGEIFQLDAHVLPGRVMARDSLLGEHAAGDNEYEEKGRKGCETYSVSG